MADTILRLGDTLVQHGPSSDRVYVMELGSAAVSETLDLLDSLAAREGYGKIVVKARASDYGAFAVRGYRLEALVPGFFGRQEPGLFLGKFLAPDRREDEEGQRVQDVLAAALARQAAEEQPAAAPGTSTAPDGVLLREAGEDDARALAACYGSVFDSYPFPIARPEHLLAEMDAGTRFFMALEDGELLAAASSEPGGAPGVVEMTDFATDPQHRGRGLATRLLQIMDREARASGIRVAYTIARATSFGMNITFARRGYRYGGTLVNNTQISGGIESMNVWFKPLCP